MPAHTARLFLDLRPKLRARVATAAFGAALNGVDLGRLLALEKALHRVGHNLNQALMIAHVKGTPLDQERINAALDLIESLRGGRS